MTDQTTSGNAGRFLEICVDSLAGARAAIAGGADQIELCSALALGGLTPSAGLVGAVVALARPAGVFVRAMVRPRPGDFAYDHDDVAVAIAEARAILCSDIDGLVFGAARDGQLDTEVLQRFCEAQLLNDGRARSLTLHRAIDLVEDPAAAVEQAIALGFDQILTSGGAPKAAEGATKLAEMVSRAKGRCRIVAASGITPANLADLIADTGIEGAHASARDPALHADGEDPFAFGQASQPADAMVVRKLRVILDKSNI